MCISDTDLKFRYMFFTIHMINMRTEWGFKVVSLSRNTIIYSNVKYYRYMFKLISILNVILDICINQCAV